MVALLAFVMAAFEKNLLDAKGLFGGNVFKNPAKGTRVKLLRTYTRKNYAVVEIHPYTRSSFVKTLIVKSIEHWLKVEQGQAMLFNFINKMQNMHQKDATTDSSSEEIVNW